MTRRSLYWFARALALALWLFAAAVAAQQTGGSFGGSDWGSSSGSSSGSSLSGSSSFGSSSSGSSSSGSSSSGGSSDSWPSPRTRNLWAWQVLVAAVAVAAYFALRRLVGVAGETLAWTFPRSALRDFPVTRRVGDARTGGFVVGHRGDLALFAATPEGEGEAVDPGSLAATGDLARPPLYEARVRRYGSAHAAVGALFVLLLVASVAGSDVAPFRASAAYSPAVGDEVEVRNRTGGGARWHDGEVTRALPGGRWRVRAHTWTDHDEDLVVETSDLQRQFGTLWGRPAEWRVPHLVLLALAATAALLVALRRWLQRLDPAERRVFGRISGAVLPTLTPTVTTLQVATISLAFDAAARRDLQAGLAAQAASARLASSDDLARALRETLATLRQRSPGLQATHAAYASSPSAQQARADFEARASMERGRYVVETLRVDAAGARTVPLSVARRTEEGGGLVVVSLVVAWSGPVGALLPLSSRDDLDGAAARFAALGPSVKALEVVWVPSEDGDVMSSAEMATVFPDLAWVDDEAAARFGRAVCASCRTAYARELGACPNCGAPLDATAGTT